MVKRKRKDSGYATASKNVSIKDTPEQVEEPHATKDVPKDSSGLDKEKGHMEESREEIEVSDCRVLSFGLV